MTATTFSAALESEPLRTYQLLLVAILLLVLVIDGIDIQLVSLVAPVILEQWGIDRAAFGPAMAAALAGMAVGVGAGGWLADRIGRRRTLLWAVLLFGAATIGAGLARDVASMTALRVLSGLGFGAAGPAALTLATEWLPHRLRPHVISLLAIGTPVGGMIGASLVMLILPAHGWPATFFACGLATLLVALAGALILRESPAFLLAAGRRRDAELAAARLIGRPIALRPEDAPSAAPDAPPDAGAPPGLFTAAHRRLAAGSSIAFFCAAAVAYAFAAWTPVLLTARGFTLDQALVAAFAYNLASMIGALLAGLANRALGSRRILILAALALLGCVLALGLIVERHPLAPDATTRLLVTLLAGGAGGFVSLAVATIYMMMTLGFPPHCRAGGIGLGMMAGRLGGIATSFAGGYLLNASGASFWPFFGALGVGAGVICLGALVADRHVLPARKERGA